MTFFGRKFILIVIAIIVVIIAAYFAFYFISMKGVKEPKYKVISKHESIEVRYYAPMIIAEVKESGTRDAAISKGFRLLADYIFGNNIKMTAPVIQQKSQKIAMTAPVIQTRAQDDSWYVRFVMPHKYTLKTLPKPNNPNVKIYEHPAFYAAVIRFSGSITKQNLKKHLEMLKKYIDQEDINVAGQPIYAFYNPPWTLPLMHRNEIMFKVTQLQ